MAATALLSPATAYHVNRQQFMPSYHPPQVPPSVKAMVSSSETKRPSNDTESGSRQSLPSISEVLSATKPTPMGSPQNHPLSGSQNLPPPFTSAGPPPPPPRSESGPEPRSVPAHDDKYYRYPSRHDPGPPQGHQSSYLYAEHRDLPKASEPPPSNNHIIPQAPSSIPYPPGQLPLNAAPPPARHHGTMPSYDPHRPPPPPRSEEEYATHPTRYDTPHSRPPEMYGYIDLLGKISWNANTVRNFAEIYMKAAADQHTTQSIPDRIPTEKEVSELLDVTIWMKSQLENVRDIVQHSLAEKARDSNNRNSGPSYDGDEDMNMYGENAKPTYNMGEVKKRRGRAAPPGRCHSCNRVDTPEWRRGPDGARTLCNACGLHYAKLERKRQMEQRSIRPKAVEERS
ncbi:hypothetical protein GGS20DRAFT_583566 [Poronia punctata]|nr:hypothetical protein GGS20DRAFT_583566 [Poronia punctata]